MVKGSDGWKVKATRRRAEGEAAVGPGRPARPALMLNLMSPESRP